ncbi:MAG TPA: Ig-like domain-containing protein [Gemmatimonadaceae bacterium]|nr:Ig-like domain-containing protein [Gemmatimonadaceae bacterium]
MNRVFALAVVCGVLAACSSDGPTGPSPTTVTAIVVTAPSPTMQVGTTMTATARLLNSKGDSVGGKVPKWSSSAASVATVDQNGVITAVAPGSVEITAAADKATGGFPLIVDVDRCENPLSMSVGQVSIQSGPAAVSCITIAAATENSQLLFIAANVNTVPDDEQTFAVSFLPGTIASISPAGRIAAASVSAEMNLVAQSIGRRDAIETRIRGAESQILRAMSARGVTRAAAQRASASLSVSPSVAAAAVGDTITYRVPDVLASNLCTNFATVRAVVKAVGKKSQIVQDVNASTNGFTAADFTAIAAEFDDLTYKTDTAWFGSPTDINKDGKITILYTPEVNKFTPKGSPSYIGGFFWGGDLFTTADYTQAGMSCPQTNEQEIFYLLAADPSGEFGDARSTALVRQATRGTIAHEFQHMINQGIRQFDPAVTAFEVDWLNEGLSHFAEEAVGRAARGFGDFQSLASSDVKSNADDYNAYFQQNLARFSTWLARPDTSSPISSQADRDLAPRGAAWALLRYAADQFAPGNARAFFRGLVAGPKTGVTNFVQHAGVSFDQIIGGWLIANYADNLGIPNLDARYSYVSWNMRDAISGARQAGTYPLPTPAPGVSVTTTAQSGSGVYFLAPRPTGAPLSTFRMLDPGGGNVGFDGARVYVVRVQ